MEKPKCTCFKTPHGQGDTLVDSVGAQLMTQLDAALRSICPEAVPYVLANWAMGVVMLKGLEDNLTRSEEDIERQKCDIDMIRLGSLQVVDLIPQAPGG
jgi:hypothetical protein